jgi:hypothetical protein
VGIQAAGFVRFYWHVLPLFPPPGCIGIKSDSIMIPGTDPQSCEKETYNNNQYEQPSNRITVHAGPLPKVAFVQLCAVMLPHFLADILELPLSAADHEDQ